jgi:hypothetical protein
MQAPPEGSLGAIRTRARTRESRASKRLGSVNAVVCGHAYYRHSASRRDLSHQRSHHTHQTDDFRPCVDLKAANRRAVPFATTGYPRRRGSMPRPI